MTPLPSSSSDSSGLPKRIEFLARGILTSDERVLLCAPVSRAYAYLPGGHVEAGESAEEAVAREFEEELGVRPTVGAHALTLESAFVQGGKPKHEVNVVFHVEHASSDPLVSQEADITFFWSAVGDLRSHNLLPAPLAPWLETWLAGGSLPTWLSDGAFPFGHRDESEGDDR